MGVGAPRNVNLDAPVTEHMRTEVARLRVGQTIADGLAAVREARPAERIIYFYVVDDENRLKGVVPTRRLLLNPPETPVTDIMVKEVIMMPRTATVLEACEFFTLHRLLAFPVVDEEQRLLGAVDVELYTTELSDIERNEYSDELFQLIGVHLVEAKQLTVGAAFRSRFPWLLCNIAGGILAAVLTGVYEAELKQVVALALFIPVVLALAESVGIQSVSLALRVMHGQQPTVKSIVGKVRSEVMTGAALGLASALAVALVGLVWLRQFAVAACLLAGITGGVTSAAVIGVAIPNVLRLLQREPQVAAGPIALASADMVTLLIYFSTARLLL